ncbi:MAG TPA: hypothetical protein VKH42_12890 [Vicinamibacterales bacterium]|nr:hypothetical protein [Vicinamibacterales bacterium]
MPPKFCKSCKHIRLPAAVQLFDAKDFNSVGVMKAQMELDQENKQRARLELQRIQEQKPITYEPMYYEWCAKFTRLDLVNAARRGDSQALDTLMADGGAMVNPVTGEITPLYVMCAWKNTRGDCPGHEPA